MLEAPAAEQDTIDLLLADADLLRAEFDSLIATLFDLSAADAPLRRPPRTWFRPTVDPSGYRRCLDCRRADRELTAWPATHVGTRWVACQRSPPAPGHGR